MPPHSGDSQQLRPDDIDVVQIYDAFSPLILISLENYGFCGRGEAPGFIEGGTIRYGGKLPVNTSGGGLSEAYVHGMNLITEGVRQLRGTSTSQVADATSCLVTSGEGVPTSALILRTRDELNMSASFSPLEEADAAPFFEAARRGELQIQTCDGCGRRRFPPRPMCPWCHSLESQWLRQSGRGRIWSFAVPHPPLLPAFVDEAPYVVVVVELEEDPRDPVGRQHRP